MKARAPTVFIVDDNEAVRNSLQLLVKSIGLRASTLVSAQDFLGTYDAEQPGCLLLDVRMPGMSGLELQQHLNRSWRDDSRHLHHRARRHCHGG